MDQFVAQKLVKDTLQNPFNEDSFVYFVRNLFNFFEEAAFIYRGNFIPDSFKAHIKTFERIGKYQDPEGKQIDILTVRLKKETSLEYARTTQRNFIAWYLNGSRGGKLKDAALIAFVSPSEEDWRFSLVKMEYKIAETPKGKIKAEEEFTPARRYSFLVGRNEATHTAQSRLVPVLESEKNPSLNDLEEVFSIEKVTQEFFERYRELFLKLKESLDKIVKKDKKVKEDFKAKNVYTVDFAKKLLGQIVFLYFLQKKGWFGVKRDADWGTEHKDFLRQLFEKKHGDYKNFFNDILEHLFYDALARPRDDDYYGRFNCKIPFLNGGLFDPIGNYDWVHTDIILDDEIFSNDNKTKEGDTGNGILDIFDRYNFTVREDEPLEKEVAVDPEMLGKVFENLLEVKDRKSKGTYYTPREIVHYMCEQSLINYLATELPEIDKKDIEEYIKIGDQVLEHEYLVADKGENSNRKFKISPTIIANAGLIDKKLADIKVCDPAIGSGAFPVGMMNEIVNARIALNPYINKKENRTAYDFKNEAITNSLYGVDIDPGAVEIAKLRLWLSLVVDEEDIHHIKPLPNLDYKIMQGNSLLEEFEGIKLFDERLILGANLGTEKRVKELLNRQKEISREYLKLHQQNMLTDITKNALEKELKLVAIELRAMEYKSTGEPMYPSLFKDKYQTEELRTRLNGLHEKYFAAIHREDKTNLKKQIEELEWSLIEATLEEQNKKAELKRLNKFKKLNTKPFFLWKLHFAEVFQLKGGFDVVIANPPYVKEYVNRTAFDGLRNSPYYQGKMDLWYLFACRGIDLSRNASGIVTFIAQNNWVTSYGAMKMRNKVITGAQILSLIDFGNLKIFEAGIQTMVMIFKKNTVLDSYSFGFRRLKGNSLELKDVISLLNKENNIKAEYLTPTITRSNFIDKTLTFSSSNIESILEKILSKANLYLNSNKEVAQGMVCPQDYVNKSSQEILGANFKVGGGIFILSDDELKNLKFSKEELSLVKPLYTTDELHKWWGDVENKKWIIYTDSSFKNKKKIDEYPAIKEHLDRFKKVITSDNKPYGLHRARDEYFFKGEKILAVRKCVRPTFTYTNFDSYVTATFYVIKTERVNQQYLTGLLNSRLIAFWLRHRGKMQGVNFQIDKEPILALPLLQADQINQNTIANIVMKIIAITKDNNYLLGNTAKQAKVKEYEHQIDQMVYKLYGLTPEEIKIVNTPIRKNNVG